MLTLFDSTFVSSEAIAEIKNSLANQPRGPVLAASVRLHASYDPRAIREDFGNGIAIELAATSAAYHAKARYFAEAFPEFFSVEDQRYNTFRDSFLYFPYSPKRVVSVIRKLLGRDSVVSFAIPYRGDDGETIPEREAEGSKIEEGLTRSRDIVLDDYDPNFERVSNNGFICPSFTEAQAMAFDGFLGSFSSDAK